MISRKICVTENLLNLHTVGVCILCSFPILRSITCNKNVCNREEIIYLELYNFCVLFMTHFWNGGQSNSRHTTLILWCLLIWGQMKWNYFCFFFWPHRVAFDLHISFQLQIHSPSYWILVFLFNCYKSRLFLILSRSLPIRIQNILEFYH